MIKKTKNFLLQVFKISLSGGLVYWLIKTDKLDIHSIPLLFKWPFIFYAFLLIILGVLFVSERWFRLLNSQKNFDSSKITRLEIFKLNMIGMFFNFSMPGGVGGDLVKAFFFFKDHKELKVASVTSVIMDRVLGLYAMIFMAFVSMATHLELILTIPSLKILFYLVCLSFFGSSFGLALLFSKRIHKTQKIHTLLQKLPLSHKTHKLYESLHLYGASKKTLAVSVALSLLAQTSSVMFIYFLSESLGYHLGLLTHFVVAPLGFIATALPLSPAGIGVGQAAFYYLYKTLTHLDNQLGPLTMTGYQVCTFLLSLTGAIFYISRKDHNLKNQQVEEALGT